MRVQDPMKRSTSLMEWAGGLRDQEEVRRQALGGVSDGERKKQLAVRLLSKLAASYGLDKQAISTRLRARTTTPTLRDVAELGRHLSSDPKAQGKNKSLLQSPVSDPAAPSEALRARMDDQRVPERDEWFLINVFEEKRLQERTREEMEKKKMMSRILRQTLDIQQQEVKARHGLCAGLRVGSQLEEANLQSLQDQREEARRLLEARQAELREERAKQEQEEVLKKKQREQADKSRRESIDKIRQKVKEEQESEMAEIRKIKKELKEEAKRIKQKKQKMREEYDELMRYNEEEKARNSRELKQQVLLDIQAAKEYEQVLQERENQRQLALEAKKELQMKHEEKARKLEALRQQERDQDQMKADKSSKNHQEKVDKKRKEDERMKKETRDRWVADLKDQMEHQRHENISRGQLGDEQMSRRLEREAMERNRAEAVKILEAYKQEIILNNQKVAQRRREAFRHRELLETQIEEVGDRGQTAGR
ncbi:hypothetical protein GUITHDRAFT_163716 [Guillardia theta CCMP2712]|uniref:Trichohyalin-plectin-homology domain-containing protein n=1 Tax=Guillardia theta (strain CCMP2712) TaxID=905079 RepID=L1J7G1_GUITC|nr:hypothetical protein GUITHDRAFT_163716 [Guillardia theta CCMP2712]EKX44020.1 hypothetical protein GUITHDRAFT_163716 [Guillardia theta CCMP2712]|eukprot:XP_005831000.1 hypothetical protein GUITHDRAFT_163716 [Guillardia theta CCMP2712]